MKTFILGGCRSGKSHFAEELTAKIAQEHNLPITTIVTANINEDDLEMKQRIFQHQQRRPKSWRVVIADINLGQTLMSIPTNSVILLDCLTLWLSQFYSIADKEVRQEKITTTSQQFILQVQQSLNKIIIVSDEVGMGIIPMDSTTREYRDNLGILNQKVAKLCQEVFLITAGLPLKLK